MSERLTNSAGVLKKCEPTSCMEFDCSCNLVSDALDKLAHYEDLEQQGRLIELPCKVGDTVYRIFAYCDSESGAVCSVHTCPCDYKNYEIFEKKFEISDFDKFGKTIFLNKAEAEAKLKELNNNK